MLKTLSVYFNGTDDSEISEYGMLTLASLLHEITVKNDHSHSICVQGCGINNRDIRDFDYVFAFNLEKQVVGIAEEVKEMIQNNDGNVIVNIYGFGRGGVAAFLLAQKLKDVSADRLILNIVAFEPVPGNFITAVYGDLLLGVNNTLSAAVADLTVCNNIANMLVLFTNRPMPDTDCHAPILPALPSRCQSEVEVTLGYHKSAVLFCIKDPLVKPCNASSILSFHRVMEFMNKCGTIFDFDKLPLSPELLAIIPSKSDNAHQELLNLHDRVIVYCESEKKRSMHLRNSIFTARDNKEYLNRYHQQLCKVPIDEKNCILTIKNRNPKPMTSQYRKAILLMQLTFILAMIMVICHKYFPEVSMNNTKQRFPRI
jgi:hypothetical protein